MNRFDRRLFLEQLMAVAAGVGGSTGFAAAPAKKRKSAAERLGVAVLGAGGRGSDHAKAFASRSDCAVLYVCDADSEAGPKLAQRVAGKPRFVQDLRRVFDDPAVDIVSVATPNHWHSLAAIWAMQAGKDVYVEKPVSHNITEGRRLVETARKHGRICQGGTQHRSEGANRAAAEYVRQGKLGEVKLIHTCTYRLRTPIGPKGSYPVPPSVDYNLWAGPAPMEMPVRRERFHYDWHWFWDYGNGELGNNSVHPVDTARMIVGLEGLGGGVMSCGARVGLVDSAETPSVQLTVHDFAPLTLVQEVRNLKTDKPRHGGAIFIEGTAGYVVSQYATAAAFDPSGKLIEKLEGPDLDHFGNFIDAVRSRRREDQNAEIAQGHVSTALIHVANISQRLGRPAQPGDIVQALEQRPASEHLVETFDGIRQHLAANGIDIVKTPLSLGPWLAIDADRERFEDEAANAFLSRQYRAPFLLPGENEI